MAGHVIELQGLPMSQKPVDPPGSRRAAWAYAGFTSACLVAPLFFVTLPPITDIPQHLAQIQLLEQTLAGETTEYAINWTSPNTLVYLPLYLLSQVLAPVAAGKAMMGLLAVMWVGAIHYLARARGRGPEVATLASLLVYNTSFYWGFINFQIGFPFFVLLIVQAQKPPGARRGWTLLALFVLLFLSHALWFLVGAVYLFIIALTEWRGIKAFIWRLAPGVPVGLISIVWYVGFSIGQENAGVEVRSMWQTMPWVRLHPGYFIPFMLSGALGLVERFASTVIVMWVLLVVYENRRRLKHVIDRPLGVAALMLLAAVLLGPEAYMNTVLFSQRWLPVALVLLLIALPLPQINPSGLRWGVVGLLLLVVFNTARAWVRFEATEMTGFQTILETLPENQRVIGLDYPNKSRVIDGYPFMQMFAYSQVLNGCELNFSFAEHNTGIVRFKEFQPPPWTRGLEWIATDVRREDFAYFDYAIVNGDEPTHQSVIDDYPLKPVTASGRWRLYRVGAD
jgi:hypothetical protein